MLKVVVEGVSFGGLALGDVWAAPGEKFAPKGKIGLDIQHTPLYE